VKELETAVMFWAGRDPVETLAPLTRLGLRCGQLAIPGELNLDCASEWSRALRDAAFTVFTVVAAYEGEDYTDIPAVRRTVGLIPPTTRAAREQRTCDVSDFAAAIGARGIATHIGFVPADSLAVRDVVRRICDHAARHNQTFALETGQESAPELLAFLRDVQRDNLGINFDPANMILYGTGGPVEALGILAPHVLSVHCKDGDWPPPGQPGALGTEKPLGAGAVGVERFLTKLRQTGYRGPLAIEREGVDPARWIRDVEAGIRLIENWKRG
jgi:sugar phosphate isomerase/epimerase